MNATVSAILQENLLWLEKIYFQEATTVLTLWLDRKTVVAPAESLQFALIITGDRGW